MKFLLLICLAFFSLPLAGVEINEGPLRLVLHPRTGHFSLYSVDDAGTAQALFYDRDPRTSFLTLIIDNRTFKLGSSSVFRPRLGEDPRNPSIIFESPFMTVNMSFSFLRSPANQEASGIRINFNLENKSENPLRAGARFLLDTKLSEETSGIEFITDKRRIASEAQISQEDSDLFWIDRKGSLSLAGSLAAGSPGGPDRVHFANWQRFNNASWRAPFREGRNFNFLPFSIGDSAICYFFEPLILGPGERRNFHITLAPGGEEIAALIHPLTYLVQGISERERDLAEIRDILTRIDLLMAMPFVDESELSDIEIALAYLRARYMLR